MDCYTNSFTASGLDLSGAGGGAMVIVDDIHQVRYQTWKSAFDERMNKAFGLTDNEWEAVEATEDFIPKHHSLPTESFGSNASEMFQQEQAFHPPESSSSSYNPLVQDEIHMLAYRRRRRQFSGNSSSSSGVSSQYSSTTSHVVKISASPQGILEEMMRAATLKSKLFPSHDSWKEDEILDAEAEKFLQITRQTFQTKYNDLMSDKLSEMFSSFAHIELLQARGVNLIRREKSKVTLGFVEKLFERTEADFGICWLNISFSDIRVLYDSYDDPCEMAVMKRFGNTYKSLYAHKKAIRVHSMNEIMEQLRKFQVKIERILDQNVCFEETQLEMCLKEGEEEAKLDCCKQNPELEQKFHEILEAIKNVLRKNNLARRGNEGKFARKAMKYATTKYCEFMEAKLNLKTPLKAEELTAYHEITVTKIINSCFEISGFWYTGPWRAQQIELQKYVKDEYAEFLRSYQAKLKLWEAELQIQTEDIVASFRRKIMKSQCTAWEESEMMSKRKDLIKSTVQRFRKQCPGVGPARVKALTTRLDTYFETYNTRESPTVSFVWNDAAFEACAKIDATLDGVAKIDAPIVAALAKPEAPLVAGVATPEAPLDVVAKPQAAIDTFPDLNACVTPDTFENPEAPPLHTLTELEKDISITGSLKELPLKLPAPHPYQTSSATPTLKNAIEKKISSKRPISPSNNVTTKPVQQTRPVGGVGVFFTFSQVYVSVELKDKDAVIPTFVVPLNLCLEQTEEDESPVLVEEKNNHKKPGHCCINFYSMIVDPLSVHTHQKFTYKDVKEKLWAEEILAMFFKRIAKIILQRFDADITSTVMAIGLPASTPGVCKQRIKTALPLAGLKSGGIFLQVTTSIGLSWIAGSLSQETTASEQAHSLAFYVRESLLDVAVLELKSGKVNVVSLHPGLKIPGLSPTLLEGCVSQKLATILQNMTKESGINMAAIKFCTCVIDLTGFDSDSKRPFNNSIKENFEKLITTAFTPQKIIPSVTIKSVMNGIMPGLTVASSSFTNRLAPQFQERFPFTVEVFGLVGVPNKKKLVLANDSVRECILRIPVTDISVNKDQVIRVKSHRSISELSTTEMKLYAIQQDQRELSSWQIQIRVDKEGVISCKTENKITPGVDSSATRRNSKESLQLVKTICNCMPKEDFELTRKRLNRIWAASSNRRRDDPPLAKRCKI